MRDDWKYWVALSMVDGIGEVSIKNLFTRFHNAKDVLTASKKELSQVEGIKAKQIESIRCFNDWKSVDIELSKIEREGVRLLPLSDPEFPESLLRIYNPPPYLYIRGDITNDDEISIAVVGSRIPSRYGRTVTENIAGELASMGITIISGMARGIDSIAHSGSQ